MELVHKHFKMGQGVYRLVGIWSAPSKSILEANPTAYNNMMNGRPKCCRMSCDHCGTGITNHFIIKDELGQEFSVGSSCIEKLGQVELITQAKKAERERQKKIRQQKAELIRKEKQAKLEAKLESQRKANGGLTDYELRQKEKQIAEQKRTDAIREIAKPILTALYDSGSNFCYSVIGCIEQGFMPIGRGKPIVIEIMAKYKSGSRKGTHAYDTEYENAEVIFDSIAKKISELK